MNELTTSGTGTPPESLHAELRALIEASRQRLAGAVNAELTRLYWTVGQRLASEVLGGERAGYGARLLDQLGQQLSQEFGRGFESRNLRRMVKFAQAFPDAAIVSTLSTQLSWSHLVAIVALKTPQARAFYAQRAAQEGWSVRELSHQIERKAFERTEIAASQSPALPATPAQVFKDPRKPSLRKFPAMPGCWNWKTSRRTARASWTDSRNPNASPEAPRTDSMPGMCCTVSCAPTSTRWSSPTSRASAPLRSCPCRRAQR